MSSNPLKYQVEALVLASDEPISMQKLRDIIGCDSSEVRSALAELEAEYSDRGIQLIGVSGGWQFRTAPEYSELVQQLWQTRPPRMSRSALETLAIIAYRQPTTRAEIEALRGVKVSSQVVSTLQERGWIKVLGRKEVPGRPHLYGTGKQFLVDFGLNSLRDLPESAQLLDEEEIIAQIDPQTESEIENYEQDGETICSEDEASEETGNIE